MMETEFVDCVKLGEKKDDIIYVYKGLGLKRKALKLGRESIKVIGEKNTRTLRKEEIVTALDNFRIQVLFFA